MKLVCFWLNQQHGNVFVAYVLFLMLRYQPSFHGVDLSALRGAAVDEYFRQPIVVRCHHTSLFMKCLLLCCSFVWLVISRSSTGHLWYSYSDGQISQTHSQLPGGQRRGSLQVSLCGCLCVCGGRLCNVGVNTSFPLPLQNRDSL